MATNSVAPFIFGQGGVRLSPEDIAQQRKTAQAMMARGMDYSPVQSPWQSAARVAQALLGGYQSGEADRESANMTAEGEALFQKLASRATGAGAPSTAPASVPMQLAPSSSPAAEAIRAGLVQRGLPEHVADGFMMNFRDESGLNPGINEAQPLVPGSRGGFGLAQWTGPRRVALEQFAQAAGRPVDDPNVQLDFLASELQGPEAKAAQSIMAAQTPGDAAAAIARDYLRPAPENLDRRVAQYVGGAPTSGSQRPSIDPLVLQAMNSRYEPARKIGTMLFQNMLEQQSKANDPLRALQIRDAQTKLTPLNEPYLDAGGNLVQRDPLGKVNVLRPAENRPTSVGEYQFYADQERGAGREPLPYEKWDRQRRQSAATNVNVNAGENAYQKALGTGVGGDVIKQRQEAQDASDLIKIIHDGRSLLDQGAITGAGASYKVGALKWASALGVDVPQGAANNSDAFRAVMGSAVGKIIKQFGAGSGLSDADRDYAERIAGGKIDLNEAAIRKVMEIGEKAARGRISAWQKRLPDVIKGDIGSVLSVESPPEYAAPNPPSPQIDDLLKKYGGSR